MDCSEIEFEGGALEEELWILSRSIKKTQKENACMKEEIDNLHNEVNHLKLTNHLLGEVISEISDGRYMVTGNRLHPVGESLVEIVDG